MVKKAIVVLALIALSACSSIKSIERSDNETAPIDGLRYFMPKKDLVVRITIKEQIVENPKEKVSKNVTEKVITKIAFETTPSYPDLSKHYVIRYEKNLIGKNALVVHLNEVGLLSSAKSTTVSQLSDVFKNLAATAGLVKAVPGLDRKKEETCEVGDHSFVHDFSCKSPLRACGMIITTENLAKNNRVPSHTKAINEEHSGIFYRQPIPYRVTAKGHGLHVASIVFSPSESATHFLPISETFASNNEADFEFAEGVPTKYKQDTDGELVALLKLPADIIGAYFGAIGMVFDSFKTTDAKEAAALAESLKLELAKKKYDACISAINAGNTDLITALGCKE